MEKGLIDIRINVIRTVRTEKEIVIKLSRHCSKAGGKNYVNPMCSCPRDFRLTSIICAPLTASVDFLGPSQICRTVGFKEGPQLGPHCAERIQSLGQCVGFFAAWQGDSARLQA